MKPGELVKLLDWNSNIHRNYERDPNSRERTGIILEVGTDFAGYELLILTDCGKIAEFHESIHRVEVVDETR